MNQELSLWGYFVQAFKQKYCDFSGRARRKEYWGYVLFAALIQWAMLAVAALSFGAESVGFYVVYALIALAFILPALSVTVRRLHDLGKSGWWIFIAFIPFVGSIALLVFMCLDSEVDENAYGPNPKGVY